MTFFDKYDGNNHLMNNINYDAYANMLSLQAKMCFPFESGVYLNHSIHKLNKIGEIGCGNASYANKLTGLTNEANFICIDHDEKILNKASNINSKIKTSVGDIRSLPSDIELLISRLVLHQIEDRDDFIDEVGRKLKTGNKLIIIDSYDKYFKLIPKLEFFSKHLSSHRKKLSPRTASRNLKNDIIYEVEKREFKLIDEQNYYVPSTLPKYKEYFKEYMLETAKIFGINSEINKDIQDWFENMNSYAQIGLFICVFEKL
tara:strand:+ start:149 stop:925 length:777 start_codon:yes stop_codon:yes gene_type:complete